jgi:hypothetical protein
MILVLIFYDTFGLTLIKESHMGVSYMVQRGKFYYGPHLSLLAWESVLPGNVNISLNKQIALTILFENTMTHSIHLGWIRQLATIWSSVASFMKEQFPSLHQRLCYTYHEARVLDPKVWCIIELHSYSASYTINKTSLLPRRLAYPVVCIMTKPLFSANLLCLSV